MVFLHLIGAWSLCEFRDLFCLPGYFQARSNPNNTGKIREICAKFKTGKKAILDMGAG
jgi:hypothetical protein